MNSNLHGLWILEWNQYHIGILYFLYLIFDFNILDNLVEKKIKRFFFFFFLFLRLKCRVGKRVRREWEAEDRDTSVLTRKKGVLL